MTHLLTIVVASTVLVTAAGGAGNPALCAQLKRELPVETRIREIAKNMRCPVCQGQSGYDPNSGLACQMKQIIRDKTDRRREPAIAA